MKGKILLSVLFLIIFSSKNYASSRIVSFDTSGIQNNVPMNHPSNVPFADKYGFSNFYIWPNPAREKINVYVNSIRAGEQGECVVYNNAGQPVLQQWIRNGNNTLYLGKVQEGIYIVTIADKNRDVISKRILVSR